MKKSEQFQEDLYQYQYSSSFQSKSNKNTLTKSVTSGFATNKSSDTNTQSRSQKNTTGVIRKTEPENEKDLKIGQNQDPINFGSISIASKLRINRLPFMQRRPFAIHTLQKILAWRKHNPAPVDSVGCERLHDPNEAEDIQKFQTLIALILSVQTKDETTAKVMQKLKNHGLNPTKISQTEQSKLLELIYESNFNRKKAKNIIQISKIILQEGLPKSIEDLVKLPGIGVKIATIYMRVAEGANDGIGVDTHVHRISYRLGWTNNAKNPNQTEKQLQQLFPKQCWSGINVALVGMGQILCESKKPKCESCPVAGQCQFKTAYFQF